MGIPIPIGTGIKKPLQQHPHAPKHDSVPGEIVLSEVMQLTAVGIRNRHDKWS